MEAALDIALILLLIAFNALFALSELALVSANRARLAVLERKGVAGAGPGPRAWPRTRSCSCRPCRSASPLVGVLSRRVSAAPTSRRC